MEKDGVTRVYATYGTERPWVHEVYPQQTPVGLAIRGADAVDIFLRTDARCFRTEAIKGVPAKAKHTWRVQTYEDDRPSLELDIVGSTAAEQYAHLADSVEEIIGRLGVGLTVLAIEYAETITKRF